MTTGGTIGLFLGASIVSVVEAGFWIYKVSSSIQMFDRMI